MRVPLTSPNIRFSYNKDNFLNHLYRYTETPMLSRKPISVPGISEFAEITVPPESEGEEVPARGNFSERQVHFWQGLQKPIVSRAEKNPSFQNLPSFSFQYDYPFTGRTGIGLSEQQQKRAKCKQTNSA